MVERLSGATRLFPIIGDPIRFVQSPARLTATFAARGHDAVCVPLQVPDGSLDVVMAGLDQARNVDGILVTMPHKFAAFACCATSSDRAKLFDAVSVMRRNPDRTWHGDMLDGLAFVKAQRDNGAVLEGARALVVGAGGAGSSIAAALLDDGVRDLVVADTNAARVNELASLLSDRGTGRVTAGAPDPMGFDLVFNATPLGLRDGDPLPIDVDRLTASMFVGDVIAGHGRTPLIAAAQARGCRTADGAQMVTAVQELMADFLLAAEATGR